MTDDCMPAELTVLSPLPQASRAMPNTERSQELGAALDAARAAADVIRGFYQRNVKIEVKADKTPVTEADVKSEEAIRDLLTKRFPSYGFYGEETGKSDMNAESVWLVDPIDGTKSFVRECPFFSTQIALMRDGRFVLGVSCAPAYDEIAWAESGKGAYLNGKPISVSRVAALDGAIVSSGNLKTLAKSPAWPRFANLIGATNRIRGYGDFVHYHLLARGALDVVIESDVNILDIAALTVIVEEAGGTFTDLKGAPVSLETTTVLATNAALHGPVMEIIRFGG
jgi:histidinol-phosphatase